MTTREFFFFFFELPARYAPDLRRIWLYARSSALGCWKRAAPLGPSSKHGSSRTTIRAYVGGFGRDRWTITRGDHTETRSSSP